MSEEEKTAAGGTEAAQTQMPAPPCLSSVFQKHSQQIEAACQKAGQAFSAIKSRDQDLSALIETLNQEVQKVFVIAAAAKSPELALASIPPVLALANAAFAEVPLTDQKSQTALQAAFAPFAE